MPRLFLVDASGYIFRAYYAIRPLSNSKGLPTNALYGFTSMLLKLLKEEKPEMIGIVFDVARKTFRNEKYPEYKANRSDPPPDLVPQFPYFRKIVKALNLPVLELPNYEADDVIATIATQFEKKGWETVVVSGDKDLMQLVDEEVIIYDSMKEKWIRTPEVKERFGVLPSQVTDILGLAGDTSDNIPGVPGIGEKTATKLILEYGSLEKVLENAENVKGKLGEKLREFAAQARLSKELATVFREVPLEYNLDDFKIKDPDPELMKEVFGELEFKAFLQPEASLEKSKTKKEEKSSELDLFQSSVVERGISSDGVSGVAVDSLSEEIIIGNYLLDPDKRSAPISDFGLLKKRLEQEGLIDLFLHLELPLVSVLKTMEENGVKLDIEQLQQTSVQYGKKLKSLEKKVHELAGVEFNLNSPKQLGTILFEKLQLPVIRKTKTGYSTDVEVLTELASHHPIPKVLLEYRMLSKLKSTYLDALVELVDSQTSRIHTSFHQTVAATGRLSSSDPNLQNIPIRSEEGRKIRESFVAENGFVLLSADYSQIELRILAHLSQDKALLKAFHDDLDIHQATASRIYQVPEFEVTDSMRAVGKTVNFAVLYGQGAFSLSKELEIPLREAEKYIQNYFSEYEGVKVLKEKILHQARQEKIVRTLFGRLRRFPDIDHKNGNIRAMAERTAFNTVFQGTAADLIKHAMIAIDHKIRKDFPKCKMILQVHDELVFEVPENLVSDFSKMVVYEMSHAANFSVPLKVDVGSGSNWAEAH